MSKPKTFVFNDETVVNSYGFRTLNAGISCVRFDENSAMLDGHDNSTEATLGNWTNRRVDGFKMLGDAVFDLDLESGKPKQVAGQVERGFVKACSMGLGISFNEEAWVKAPDGVWELTKCELMEVSICTVPSNAGSLALFNITTGKLIAEDEFKLSLKNLSATEFQNPKNIEMSKIILSTAALSVLVGLNISSQEPSENEISRALVDLSANLKAEEEKTKNLTTKLNDQLKLQAEALVDGAIKEQRVLKGERDELIADAMANYKLTAKFINSRPAKANLSGQVNNVSETDDKIKTFDDFQGLPLKEQLAFKNDHPDKYAAMFA